MIFDEQISRKPDHYPWTQPFKKAMQDGFWTDSEFSFSSDKQDFLVHLTPQEQVIVTRALATIGQLEISVKKFWARLGDNLPHPSLSDLGGVMSYIEIITAMLMSGCWKNSGCWTLSIRFSKRIISGAA